MFRIVIEIDDDRLDPESVMDEVEETLESYFEHNEISPTMTLEED